MPKFKKSTRGFKMKAGKEGPFKKNFPNDIGSPNKFLGGLLASGVGKLAGKALGGALGGGKGGAGGIGGALGTMVGGPLGGLAGRAIGGLFGRKRKRGAALAKKSAYKKEDKKKVDKKKYMSPQRQRIFQRMGMNKITKGYDPVTGEKKK